MAEESSRSVDATPKLYVALTVRSLLFSAVLLLCVFGAAGRWDLPMVWAYLVVFQAIATANAIHVLRTDPALIQERLKPGPGGKDPILRTVGPFLLPVHWTVAGLDIGRFHWSGTPPVAVHVVGLAGVAAAMGLAIWAMAVNRFFSSEARIQRERGQYVVTTGPYRTIRHPGYLSAMLLGVASGLALGSYWSIVPILPVMALVLRRVRIEERLLLAELEGYSDYAQRVRYRLVPGIW